MIGPEGKKVEIQIRTYDMHRIAEMGIAAHWLYKEGKNQDKYTDNLIPWIRELLLIGEDASNSGEFVKLLKRGLQTRRIIVFTPRSEVLQLVHGATPIDFAFAIHTEVGLHCRGAKVNGKMVPLNFQLKKGDKVEIITSPQAKPVHSWLELAKSAKAKAKIRKALQEQEYEQNNALGRDKFSRRLKAQRIEVPSDKNLAEVIQSFNYRAVNDFFAAIGSGKLSLSSVLKRFLPVEEVKKDEPGMETIVEEFRRQSLVVIDGIDNVLMRIASCCQPVPGDKVIGFLTRGRGVSIHLQNCPNVAIFRENEPDRLLQLIWGLKESHSFLAKIFVEEKNRKDILNNIIQAINSLDVDIRRNETEHIGKLFFGRFILEVTDHDKLNKVINKLKKLDGVDAAGREKIFKH